MYYSKNGSGLSIPSNYSGNAFRVADESDRTYKKAEIEAENDARIEATGDLDSKETDGDANVSKKTDSTPQLPTILSDIAAEDVLILGLIFLIHRDNPTDPTLLLLLVLLLVKG